jgi:hypothetical protein
MRSLDEAEGQGDRSEATTASYSRDEVHGPLKGLGKEEVTIEQDTVVSNDEGTDRVVTELKKEVKRTRTIRRD